MHTHLSTLVSPAVVSISSTKWYHNDDILFKVSQWTYLRFCEHLSVWFRLVSWAYWTSYTICILHLVSYQQTNNCHVRGQGDGSFCWWSRWRLSESHILPHFNCLYILVIGRCFIMLGWARASSTVLIQCFITAHILYSSFLCVWKFSWQSRRDP